MNTKISPIGKAEREQLDIETKIRIVRMQIDKYSTILYDSRSTEEMMIKAKTVLEREEKYLKELKNEYPEHFI
jgi:hypothetical protein